MKIIIAIVICLAALSGILGVLACMAGSMVSRVEEKINPKYKEESIR